MKVLRGGISGLAVLVAAGALALNVLPAQADPPAPAAPLTPAVATGAPSGPQGDTWASIAKLPDWQGIWELDGRGGGKSTLAAARPAPAKLTPAAQAKLDAYKKAQET